MTSIGLREVILDAEGQVAVMVGGKAVWMTPADINAVLVAHVGEHGLQDLVAHHVGVQVAVVLHRGQVAVMVGGKAVWMTPADINAVDAANPPFIVV
jgi:hypothetical protein